MVINYFGSAKGYEISIYEAYPVYMWIFLILSMFCGVGLMVTESFSKKRSNFWIFGFIIVAAVDFIVLLLPYIRGYFTYGRGDVLSHIGFSRDIIATGHFTPAGSSGENFYPISHILMSSVSYLTGINVEIIAEILPIFFFMAYIFFIYLLSLELTQNVKRSILITSFASILLFTNENLAFVPSMLAFFLMPLLLFLFLKANSGSVDSRKNPIIFSGLFIMILLLMPFLHSGEGTLFLIPLFVGIYISIIVYKYINKYKKMSNKLDNLNLHTNLYNILLLLFVSWFSWFVSFSIFGYQMKRIIDWLLFEIGTSDKTNFLDLLGKAHLSIFQLMDLLVKVYGQQLFYILLAIVVSVIIWKNLLIGKTPLKSEKFTRANLLSIDKWKNVLSSEHNVKLEIFIFSVLFLIFFTLLVVSFSNFIGVESSRSMRYVIFVSTILIGLGTFEFIKHLTDQNYRKIGIFLVVIFIGISGAIGIYNTFASPITKTTNYQVTHMEISGMTWFLDNGQSNLTINSIEPEQILRYSGAIVGQRNVYTHITSLEYPGEHFNYTNKSVFGESLNNSEYFMDWKLQKILYPRLFPEYENLWKFNSEDFNRFENDDPTVNNIYSNGEFWIYYISPED